MATYNAAHKSVTEGISASIPCKDNMAWKQWYSFCAWLHISTDLQGIRDPIPVLQISSHKVHTGVFAENHKPIHKRSMEQYIRFVGQIFEAVGSPDPRLNTVGAIDSFLGR